MKLVVVLLIFFYGLPGYGTGSQESKAEEKKFGEASPAARNFDQELVEELSLNTPFGRDHQIRLTNLNHHINRWFLLSFRYGGASHSWHLESVNPNHRVSLYENGISLSSLKNPSHQILCPLWDKGTMTMTPEKLSQEKHTFYPVCNNLLFVRLSQPSDTRLTLTEITAGFLRSLPVGESVINYFKPFLVGLDAESDSGILKKKEKEKVHRTVASVDRNSAPDSARMRNIGDYALVSAHNRLGIKISLDEKQPEFGRWYEASMHPGIWISLFKPELIHDDIYQSHKDKVSSLKPSEKNKLVYITAYDLSTYTINYAVGTSQPAVNTDASEFSGFPEIRKNIVPVGSIPPYDIQNAVGVFIGGFKNRHGTFKNGPYAGRTYGYIENGLELEPMSGMLATFMAKKDGEVSISRWPENREDQAALRREVVAARQNGSMLISGGVPGEFVNNWYYGNWSGSANGLGQSLRAGICVKEQQGRKFLLFMAFTSATPSAMTRVMQAYSCQDGMHLDMNAHMYLHNAIYTFNRETQSVDVEYLHEDMKYPKDVKRHRFIMDNNERDFFYIRRRVVDPERYVKR